MNSNIDLFNQIFPVACRYMRMDADRIEDSLKDKCKGIFDELMEYVVFKAYDLHVPVNDLYNLTGLKTGDSSDFDFYLNDCKDSIIIAATLGIGVDNHAKKMQRTDLSGAIIYDAMASALLEQLTDNYEFDLNLGPHTFRFAPGYGDIPLEINELIIDALALTKRIGINKTSDFLMLPQKSMITICGIGKTMAPTCGHCARLKSCSLRKDNLRCYSI